MSDLPDDDYAVVLKVSVFESNIRRLEGVALVNGESQTDAVNRALQFYEMICTAPVGQVLSWRDGVGDKHMIAILDPRLFERPAGWRGRILQLFRR